MNHYTSVYTVKPQGSGTEVNLDFTGELVAPSAFKKLTMDVMYPLMAGTTKKMLKKDLEAVVAAATEAGSSG